MIISLVDEKRIKTLLGDITYNDTKTHTITMIELLYHHRELTIKLDLDVKPSLQILPKVAQGDLAKTITQFQKEQYNLEQVYSILQDAYQDMLTVDQAQKALDELVETYPGGQNISLLATKIITMCYAIHQYSPLNTQQNNTRYSKIIHSQRQHNYCTNGLALLVGAMDL